MSWLSRYLNSSLGMKQVMALTGLGLSLFALVHMLSHLQLFISLQAYNDYAAGMQSLGGLLWVARGSLLFIVLVHILTAIRLISGNRAARPQGYKKFKPQRSKLYSRGIMTLSGLLLLAFIVFHILHFTTGTVMTEAFDQHHMVNGVSQHDVSAMVITSFSNPLVAIGYVLLMGFLCLHLAHGMSSWFQSLGLNHPKYNGLISKVGPIFGVLLFVGYASIPLGVLAQVIK